MHSTARHLPRTLLCMQGAIHGLRSPKSAPPCAHAPRLQHTLHCLHLARAPWQSSVHSSAHAPSVQVPLEYSILGYTSEVFPGLTPYAPPLLEQPLLLGAPRPCPF